MNARFKLYADLLLVRIRTNFFLVVISAFTVFYTSNNNFIVSIINVTVINMAAMHQMTYQFSYIQQDFLVAKFWKRVQFLFGVQLYLVHEDFH